MSTNTETHIIPRTGRSPLRFKGTVIAAQRFDGGIHGRVWMRLLRNSRRQFVCAVSRMAVVKGQRDSDEAVVVSGILDVVKFFGASRDALALYRDARWHGLADFIANLPISMTDEEVVEHAALWLRTDTREAA